MVIYDKVATLNCCECIAGGAAVIITEIAGSVALIKLKQLELKLL